MPKRKLLNHRAFESMGVRGKKLSDRRFNKLLPVIEKAGGVYIGDDKEGFSCFAYQDDHVEKKVSGILGSGRAAAPLFLIKLVDNISAQGEASWDDNSAMGEVFIAGKTEWKGREYPFSGQWNFRANANGEITEVWHLDGPTIGDTSIAKGNKLAELFDQAIAKYVKGQKIPGLEDGRTAATPEERYRGELEHARMRIQNAKDRGYPESTLLTRINRIKNPLKLRIFAEALEDENFHDLAGEARAKLKTIKANKKASYDAVDQKGTGVLVNGGDGFWYVETLLPVKLGLVNDRDINPNLEGQLVKFSVAETLLDSDGDIKGLQGEFVGPAEPSEGVDEEPMSLVDMPLGPELPMEEEMPPLVDEVPMDEPLMDPLDSESPILDEPFLDDTVIGSKKVRIARPKNIPKELASVWSGAIRKTASMGLLLDSRGQVDMPEVVEQYRSLLAAYREVASLKE